MQLNRLEFSITLASVALLILSPSRVIAQASSFEDKPTQSYCFQDVLSQEKVSSTENLKTLIYYCRREEHSYEPPYR